MSWWYTIPNTGPQTAQGPSQELYIYTSIASYLVDGLIFPPLGFTTQELYADPAALSSLAQGEMGIYYHEITGFSQTDYLNGANEIKLYYGISSQGDASDITTSVDSQASPEEISVTYANVEKEKLRELFGHPEGSDMTSIIADGITAVSEAISAMNLDTRFKSNAVKTLAFTDADLTILTDEEAAQGISLSMASALTRVKEAEAEVEAEAEAEATAEATSPDATRDMADPRL
jgi:hypothetical protein